MPIPIVPIQPGGDASTNATAANRNFNALEDLNRAYVVKDESGTQRVLLGRGSDGFSGLKVSKEGFDVNTATDADLVFNSNQNVFKIAQTGDIVLNYAAHTGVAGEYHTFNDNTSIPHGLGFTPVMYGFFSADGGTNYTAVPSTTFDAPSATSARWFWFAISADETNVYAYINSLLYGASVAGSTFTFKYYLLQETAN